jgi:hypothetical protein
LALAVPLSRFTPRIGGGSAFYVRRQNPTGKDTMKWFFDSTVFIENVAALIAAHYEIWLQSLSHSRNPGLDALHTAMSVSFFCSLLAVIFGGASLVVFRMMRNRISVDFSLRRTWAVFSLFVSVAIFLFGLLMPGEIG